MPLTATAKFPAKYRGAAFAAALMLGAFTLIADALAQAPAPSAEDPPAASLAPQPPAAPPAGSAVGSSRPGLLDKLGDLLRDSADGVSTGLKDINKGTLDTLTNIPMAGFASGRALCPRSANGAPDCYAATEKLCKDKGYTTGRSLDTESAETCNPRIYLPGYQRKAGDCRLDTFVTRAACQ
jgi:hypothetical protein